MILSWLNTTSNIDILNIIDIFSISISNIVFSISQQPTTDCQIFQNVFSSVYSLPVHVYLHTPWLESLPAAHWILLIIGHKRCHIVSINIMKLQNVLLGLAGKYFKNVKHISEIKKKVTCETNLPYQYWETYGNSKEVRYFRESGILFCRYILSNLWN